MRLPLFGPIDRRLVPGPPAGRLDWLCRFTYAHRGLVGPGAPENSLAAFQAAAARGLGIELDVRTSRDGIAVVFHDATLERLTAARGPLVQRSAAELGGIAIAGTGQRIARLSSVLEAISGRVPILVEIKSHSRAEAIESCRAAFRDLAAYLGRFAVISFDWRVVRWFARHAPQVPRGLSYRVGGATGIAGLVRRRLAFWRARPHFLTCDVRDLPLRLAEHQCERGLPLVAWTIRTEPEGAAARTHADAIIGEGEALG